MTSNVCVDDDLLKENIVTLHGGCIHVIAMPDYYQPFYRNMKDEE